MFEFEKIQSHQIAGIRGGYGIEHQLWATPQGVREQYAVHRVGRARRLGYRWAQTAARLRRWLATP